MEKLSEKIHIILTSNELHWNDGRNDLRLLPLHIPKHVTIGYHGNTSGSHGWSQVWVGHAKGQYYVEIQKSFGPLMQFSDKDPSGGKMIVTSDPIEAFLAAIKYSDNIDYMKQIEEAFGIKLYCERSITPQIRALFHGIKWCEEQIRG